MYKYLFLITAILLISSCSSDTEIEAHIPENKLVDEQPTIPYRLEPTEPKTSIEEQWTATEIMEYKRNLPVLKTAIKFYKEDSTSSELTEDGVPEFIRGMVTWHQAVGMTWGAINNIPETTYARMKKDILAETGKRFCFEGRVNDIVVDRSIKPPIARARMFVPYESYIYVIAVKSSGDIVSDSVAGFCGIVGEYKSEPILIGMFDLPENK